MANDYSANNPENFMPMVQDFRDFSLIARKVADFAFKNVIGKDGDRVHWTYDPDLYTQSYDIGSNLDIPSRTQVDDYMDITTKRAVAWTDDPISQAQRKDKKLNAKLAMRAGGVLGRYVDQEMFQTGVDGVANDSTPSAGAVTLSKDNMLSYLTNMLANIEEEDGADGEMWCAVDPLRRAVLSQLFVEDGFNEADAALRNGFIGKAAGMNFYTTNNLPTSVSITIDTQPTAGDTITIKGVTWTCVADGATASAGEVNIGADLADFKTIIVKAINGTTSADYTDVAQKARNKYRNAQVSAAAFSGDVMVVTGYGRLNASLSMTAGTNVISTAETGYMLAGRKGAISIGVQKEPTYYVGKEPKRPEENFIIYQLHGSKMFYENTFRATKLKITMGA